MLDNCSRQEGTHISGGGGGVVVDGGVLELGLEG